MSEDDAALIERHQTMLRNRLRKRVRYLRRWAQREGVTCWRLYDGDIPELPLSVDWYEGRLHIHVARGRGGYRHAEDADHWVAAMVDATRAAVGELLGEVAPEAVFVKYRRRQRVEGRDDQYERAGEGAAHEVIVSEGGHRFLVELATRHDTGLFLDHRQTRRLVAEHAAERRVLNLFAYTGAFSVYAAAAGARTTTSVDLSKTYLEWARRNLALNDLESTLWVPRPDLPRHERAPHAAHLLVRADVSAFVALALQSGWRYGLAVVDPPTFSTSKQTVETFDVQRDHGELLSRVARTIEPGGAIVFSSNRRRFQLALSPRDLPAGWRIEEITGRTVPPDFHGQPHRCWWLQAPPA